MWNYSALRSPAEEKCWWVQGCIQARPMQVITNEHVFGDENFVRFPFKMTHIEWGLCALCHGIQISMEAILAWHPARSTEWLYWVANSCELTYSHRPHSVLFFFGSKRWDIGWYLLKRIGFDAAWHERCCVHLVSPEQHSVVFLWRFHLEETLVQNVIS